MKNLSFFEKIISERTSFQEDFPQGQITPSISPALFDKNLCLTVKEVASKIRSLVEKNFHFLWIEGEITAIKNSQAGHLYLSLSEEEATLNAIIFKQDLASINKSVLKDGLKILAFGKLTFFEKSGRIFFIIKKILPLGIGLLLLKKEELIKKYKPLFAQERKKSLPPFPKKIALITSPFGAAIRDFLKITQERWACEILVYPVRVQGEGAEKEIAEAIRDINLYFHDVELIVITRGGGSIEDLAPFYTEEIILGIKDSQIPVVSAVGHEIDYTLCDLIADVRCPTPTAAAQKVFPDKKDLFRNFELLRKKLYEKILSLLTFKEKELLELKHRIQKENPLNLILEREKALTTLCHTLFRSIENYFLLREKKLIYLKNRLSLLDPLQKIIKEENRLSHLKIRLNLAFKGIFHKKEKELVNLKRILSSLSPLNILERGYSIVLDKNGKVLKNAEDTKEGETLQVLLAKGSLKVAVKEIIKDRS